MLFRQLFHQSTGTYTYLLGCEQSKQAIIIDPVLENAEQYIDIMNNLDLPDPNMMDIAIPANTKCGRIR